MFNNLTQLGFLIWSCKDLIYLPLQILVPQINFITEILVSFFIFKFLYKYASNLIIVSIIS